MGLLIALRLLPGSTNGDLAGTGDTAARPIPEAENTRQSGAPGVWNRRATDVRVCLETRGDIFRSKVPPVVDGVIRFRAGPAARPIAAATPNDLFLEETNAFVDTSGEVPIVLSDAYLRQASRISHEAESQFREGVGNRPADPEAQMALATFYWSRSRLPEAEASFKAAIALDPRHPAANRALAALYLGHDRAPEAEPHLRTLADLMATPRARLALADYYLAHDRTADAIPILTSLAQVREASGEANSRLAVVAYAESRFTEAHRLLDETIARLPTHPRTLLTKARLLSLEGRTDDAISLLRTVTTTEPSFAEGHFATGLLLASRQERDGAIRAFNEAARLRPRSAAARIQLARLNLTEGHAALASTLARQAIKLRPGALAPHLLLVRSLIGESDVDGAERELAILIDMAPESYEVHWLTGVVDALTDNPDSARRSFRHAITLDPEAYEPLEALVALDAQTGDGLDDAAAEVESRLARTPDEPTLLVLAARVHAAAGDAGQAEATLRRAITRNGAATAPVEMLGRLYFAQQRLDDALEQFTQLADANPRLAEPRSMVATIHQLQGRYADAEKWHQDALDIDPSLVVSANNLARLFAAQDQKLDAALALAQTAVTIAPDEPSVNETLGLIYLKKELAVLAVSSFSACVEQDPTNPTYQYLLGSAYAQTGDHDRAGEFLEAALRLQPDFPESAAARRLLSDLE